MPEMYVCDSCMRGVTRAGIADIADGEHVICRLCAQEDRERRSNQ